MKHTVKPYAKQIIAKTLPVMAGYLFLGFAFGLLMRTNGYPMWYPVIMSLIIYSGALQYAAIPLIAAPFDPFGSFLLGLMISARHLFYGIPMLKKYRDAGKVKPFLIFGLTDETFSVLSAPDVRDTGSPAVCYVFVTLLHYIYWNVGTLLGAIAGGILTVDLTGLDFALTALFVVLFVEQIKGRAGLISGMTGLVASVLALVLFGKDRMVLAAMLLILVLLIAERKVISRA